MSDGAPPDEPRVDAPDDVPEPGAEAAREDHDDEDDRDDRDDWDDGAPMPYQAAAGQSWWGLLFFAGLVLLLAGVLWWIVEEDSRSTLTLQAWLFVALVATLAPIAWHIVDIWDALRTRRAAAALFVTITLLLGGVSLGVVSWLNHEYESRMPVIDTTTSGKYTLGEASRKLLERLPGTVYATYLRYGRTDSGLSAAALDQLLVYQAASPNVVVRSFDSFVEADEAKRYLATKGVSKTSSGENEDVIVFSFAPEGKEPVPGKQKELRVDYFGWQKNSPMGGTKWLGERLISEAILELVFQKFTVYTTGGHGERRLATDLRLLREALTGQNIEVAEQPVELARKPQVPEDCDVLMVLDPQTPFTPPEAEAIKVWLEESGGTLYFAADVAQDGRRETGLESVLDGFGLYPRINYMVMGPVPVAAGPGRVYIEMRPVLIAVRDAYTDHPAVAPLRTRAGFGTGYNQSTYVELEDDPPEGVTIEPVVFAPRVEEAHSFAARVLPDRTDFQEPQSELGDKVGERLAIVATSKRLLRSAPDQPRKDARVVFIGDTDALTDQVVGQAPANLDLAMGLLQWGLRREGLIAVSERTMESAVVTVGVAEKRMAFWWPFGVTLLSLIVGAAVWWTRRR